MLTLNQELFCFPSSGSEELQRKMVRSTPGQLTQMDIPCYKNSYSVYKLGRAGYETGDGINFYNLSKYM